MPKTDRPRDIIVPCSTGRHRVRLAGGLRFWSGARCPVCRAPVDPKRTHRLLRWIQNLSRPASPTWPDRGALWGSLGFLGLVTLVSALLWMFGDKWWPTTVLLFGPRWIFLLPLAPLLPLAFLRDRALIPLLLLAGILVLGPLMGMRTGWRSVLPEGSGGPDLRIVSFNAQVGRTLFWSPAKLLAEWEPDIVGFQECGREFAAALEQIPGWFIDARSGLCLASRFEILAVSEMDREALQFAGGAGVVATYQLDLGEGRTIFLTNLHLETPREGFELIRSGHLGEGILKVQEKSFLREVELRQARLFADNFQGPHIVTGDFNTPPESRSYRDSWGDWQNAFSRTGRGVGGTRLNGWIRVRIDHILANQEWRVLEAWVESDVGSDHLPTAAIVRLR